MENKNEKPKEEKPKDSIEAANEAAERLEKANKELSELIAKQESMNLERTLGGETDAGKPTEPTEEEKKQAAAKKMLEGSGFEHLMD